MRPRARFEEVLAFALVAAAGCGGREALTGGGTEMTGGAGGAAEPPVQPPGSPPTKMCPALGCGPMCKYGVKVDAQGCPTCQCNDAPVAPDGGASSADAGMAVACPGVNPATQCPTAANPCVPSSCSCTANGWVCTADCGKGGPSCAPRDAGVVADAAVCAAGACGGPPPLSVNCSASCRPDASGKCGWAIQCSTDCTVLECGPQPPVGSCVRCGNDCAPLVCKRAPGGKCGWVSECLKWYTSCGAPVCRGVFVRDPSLPLCTTQKAGDTCAKDGDRCQVANDPCNTTMVCAASDPRMQPAGCPMSRASYKRDIRYLGPRELQRYRDELLRMKLATWRYKQDPARERLGIIIDDDEASIAVDGARDVVDLYGYASLAVASVQQQAREIEALKQQVRALQRRIGRRR